MTALIYHARSNLGKPEKSLVFSGVTQEIEGGLAPLRINLNACFYHEIH